MLTRKGIQGQLRGTRLITGNGREVDLEGFLRLFQNRHIRLEISTLFLRPCSSPARLGCDAVIDLREGGTYMRSEGDWGYVICRECWEAMQGPLSNKGR